MGETGYGSQSFSRACAISAACLQIDGDGPRAVWARLRAGSPTLLRYRHSLPSLRVRLTGTPTGRMIGEHFAIRDEGRWRFRRAQGVLPLPAEFSDYMRGRHRQAVRTNIAHARKAGITIEKVVIEDWTPGSDDTRAGHIAAGPVEWWKALDADGEVVAQAILSVDEDVALLQGLVSITTYARWLLHTEIVEELCGTCEVLLTNSDDAYLLSAGNQHFQRLLGYQITRLRFPRSPRPVPERREARPSLGEVDLQPASGPSTLSS